MEIVYDEDNPIMNIVKRLSCDLTKYVGEVILKHDIKEDTQKLVEPFSSYLGKLGIEVDLSEVKSMFKSDFVYFSTLVIRYTKSKEENPVFMCLINDDVYISVWLNMNYNVTLEGFKG